MEHKFIVGESIELEIHGAKAGEAATAKTLVEESYQDDSLLVHAPIKMGKIVILQPEQTVSVLFSQYDESHDRYEVFRFKAVVESRQLIDEIAMLKIRKIGEAEKVQRRDFFRLNYVKEMKVILNESTEQITALSKDLSLGGMRFITNYALKKDEQIICLINFEEIESISVSAAVLDSRLLNAATSQYEVRVKFIKLSREVKKIIVKNINELQAKYLKKQFNEQHEQQIEAVMPPLNVEKMEQYQTDQKFDIRLGYLKSIIWLLLIILATTLLFARPSSAYLITKMLRMPFRYRWNRLLLDISAALSGATLLLSAVGLYISFKHYGERRKSDNTLIYSVVFSIIAMFTVFYILKTKLG